MITKPHEKGFPMQINANEIYTTEETQQILKISKSTMMRMIKHGIIVTAKIGRQYRIMGKDILRLVSPKLEDEVGKIYNKGRRWLHEDDQQPKNSSQNSTS